MPHLSEFIVAEQAMGESGWPASPNIPKSYDQIAPVPENVSSEHAVFTHLLLLGFNALQRGQYRFGENGMITTQRATNTCTEPIVSEQKFRQWSR